MCRRRRSFDGAASGPKPFGFDGAASGTTMILFSGGRESKRRQGALRAPAIVEQLAL